MVLVDQDIEAAVGAHHLADPGALLAFSGCHLKIPLTVIEELDGLKNRPDGLSRWRYSMSFTLRWTWILNAPGLYRKVRQLPSTIGLHWPSCRNEYLAPCSTETILSVSHPVRGSGLSFGGTAAGLARDVTETR